MALQRADYVIRWARLLLDNGRRWNLSINEETNDSTFAVTPGVEAQSQES